MTPEKKQQIIESWNNMIHSLHESEKETQNPSKQTNNLTDLDDSIEEFIPFSELEKYSKK